MNFSPVIDIEPSATIAMNSLALEKRARGERVFNLAAGEPMVDTDAAVVAAAEQAMRDGKTHYAPGTGLPELRTAVSSWMNRAYGTDFTSDETLVTCGGKFGVYAMIHSYIGAGDEVIILAPYWVSYTGVVKMYGGTPVIVAGAEEHAWKVTPEQIRNACSEKTKMLILNNAANPSGALYSKEELEAILAVAKEKNLLVIADEVYSGLVYEGEFHSAASFSEYRDRVVVIQSCSKHLAMTGWRLGFVFGKEALIASAKKLQAQTTTGTSTISQWAAVVAFDEADRIIPSVRDEMKERRDGFLALWKEHFGTDLLPAATALYQFIPLSACGVEETDSLAFCTRVLEEANVAMVPGVAFGVEGYVRCSFGELPEESEAAITALSQYLRS